MRFHLFEDLINLIAKHRRKIVLATAIVIGIISFYPVASEKIFGQRIRSTFRMENIVLPEVWNSENKPDVVQILILTIINETESPLELNSITLKPARKINAISSKWKRSEGRPTFSVQDVSPIIKVVEPDKKFSIDANENEFYIIGSIAKPDQVDITVDTSKGVVVATEQSRPAFSAEKLFVIFLAVILGVIFLALYSVHVSSEN